MRMALKDNLEFERYNVHCTKTGEEELEIAKNENPDLIILDIKLPGMNKEVNWFVLVLSVTGCI